MATSLIVRPENLKLVPATVGDQELIDRLQQGKDYVARITNASKRSLLQHRFYWSLLSKVVENTDHYRRAESLHFWIKVKLGYVEQVEFHDSQMVMRVTSTAFDNMESDDFKAYLDGAISLICEEVIPGVSRSDLVHEIEEMLGLSYGSLWKGKAAA